MLLIKFLIFPLQKFLRLDYVYDGESVDGQLLADFTNSCFDEKDDSKATDIDVTSITGELTIHFKTGDMSGCRVLSLPRELPWKIYTVRESCKTVVR